MTTPNKYGHISVPVKYFLSSYRAASDATAGIQLLEDYLRSDSFLFADWKIVWSGTCAVLRTSIDLFKIDKRSCINPRIREEIAVEWDLIASNRDDHAIYWNFVWRERNNIAHEYRWSAYEVWMDKDGATKPANMSLLSVRPDDHRSVLAMGDGPYKGCDSLDLLRQGADWAQERIFSAIRRAGFDPEEWRDLRTFSPPITLSGQQGLLGSVARDD